jgi:pyruvate decarboxylase
VNGIGAFVTTFGPGELSAYCGVAGQYAEYVSQTFISFRLNDINK